MGFEQGEEIMEKLDLFRSFTPEEIDVLNKLGSKNDSWKENFRKGPERIKEMLKDPEVKARWIRRSFHNEEAARKRMEALRSESVRLRLSEAAKENLTGRVMDEEEREAHREPWRRLTPEEKEAWLRKSIRSKEAIEKVAESSRRYWAGLAKEEIENKMRNSLLSEEAIEKSRRSPSDPEYFLGLYLEDRFPNEWAYNGNGEKTSYLKTLGYTGLKRPDFVNLREMRIVEVFGRYRHSEEEINDRITYYKAYGLNCLVLWGYECYLWMDLDEKFANWGLDWSLRKE